MVPTVFAYHCLGTPEWVPVDARPAPDTHCWLCGSLTGGVGWRRRDILSAAFTNHPLAPCPTSQTICQACAYMTSGHTWKLYVEAHPERNLKAVRPLGWHSYSHLFSPRRTVIGLRRDEIGTMLLEPPEPPFVLSLTESGKKHHLVRAAVATSCAAFPVQVEETRIWVVREAYRTCHQAARALFDAGASRDMIETGRYHQAVVRAVGPARWRAWEAEVSVWRAREPDLLHLALFTCTRPTEPATT